LLPEKGGRTRRRGKFIEGPAELVVEVCLSSTAYDLHQKLELYERSGVREYLAVLLREKRLRWNRLVSGRYRELRVDTDGLHRSRVFPGLWLDGVALFKGDHRRVLAALNQGLASREHAAFIKKLEK
jgi:Uma2 family endonuclease